MQIEMLKKKIKTVRLKWKYLFIFKVWR